MDLGTRLDNEDPTLLVWPTHSSTQVQLAKVGSTIACGGTLTAVDSGLTLFKGATGSQYIIEAVASAGTGSHSMISGTWNMQRLVNSASNTYTVPMSGTVTLRVAHASGYAIVTTSADSRIQCFLRTWFTCSGWDARSSGDLCLCPGRWSLVLLES